MELEKFENRIKKVLGEREIKPSAAGWEKLEQRLEKKKEKRPYLLYFTSAAAIAAIFFVLGSYFTSPIASEEPQLVEQPSVEPVFQQKQEKSEANQLIASEEIEEVEKEKKPSAKRGVKNVIFEAPLKETPSEEIALTEEVTSEEEGSFNSSIHTSSKLKDQLAEQNFSREVTDHEVEALLLLATVELKADTAYTVHASDLLHQVEYELDQSFRQKVFEVVKDGLKKAKTAVANRDF